MNSRSFYFGYFTCFCMTSLYQDMMGKELYIKRVSEFWMPTTPWMWIAIYLVGFFVFVYVEIKEILK